MSPSRDASAAPTRTLGIANGAWLRERAPWIGVLVASFAFRLPPVVNAAGLNSDVAIVGLQAMHILRGEWSPLLFGSSYQTSLDSTVAALAFLIAGATPRALVLSALAGHVLLTWFVYRVLARHLGAARAAVLSLMLVFTPAAVHTYALYPPRQGALTIAFAALWALDAAAQSSRPLARFALGGALAAFAVVADPYALVIAPAALVLGVLSALDGSPGVSRWARRCAAGLAGVAAGLAPLAWLAHQASWRTGEASLSFDVVPHNLALLRDVCLPWALSTKVYTANEARGYFVWPAPFAVQVVAWIGAAIFVAGVALGGAAFLRRGGAWGVRRLGLAGSIGAFGTVAAFLLSLMVMDHFSSRYLAAVILLAPFAWAPIAARLEPRTLALVLSPYLVSAAIGGWVSYGVDVHGLAIAREAGTDDSEQRLASELRSRGVRFAIGDYWTAYRFTFLVREAPVVVPSHAKQDRYAPYRRSLMRADPFAYIVDPGRSDESADAVKARFDAAGIPVETLRSGPLVAFVARGASPEKVALP